MTNPSLDDVRSAVEDFKNYIGGTGKTMHDLAKSYLDASGELPEERRGKDIGGIFIPSTLDEQFNICLSLCRLAYLKQAKRVEEVERISKSWEKMYNESAEREHIHIGARMKLNKEIVQLQ